jgi:hypothetical protein
MTKMATLDALPYMQVSTDDCVIDRWRQMVVPKHQKSKICSRQQCEDLSPNGGSQAPRWKDLQ